MRASALCRNRQIRQGNILRRNYSLAFYPQKAACTVQGVSRDKGTMENSIRPEGVESAKPLSEQASSSVGCKSGDSYAQSTEDLTAVEEEAVFQTPNELEEGRGSDHSNQQQERERSAMSGERALLSGGRISAEEEFAEKLIDIESNLDLEQGDSYEYRSSMESPLSSELDSENATDAPTKKLSFEDGAFDVDLKNVESDEHKDSLAPLPDTHSWRGQSADFMSVPGSTDILMKSALRIAVKKGIDADGKGDGFRAQSAQIRDPSDRFPHCRQRRGMRRMASFANPFWKKKHMPEALDKKGRPIEQRLMSSDGRQYTQYRITSIDSTYENKSGQSHFGQFAAGIYDDETPGDSNNSCCHFKPNQMVVSYLFWAFRSSFMAVLLSAAVWFTSLTFLFALCIYLIGWMRPNCIHVNGVDFGESGWFTDLMDAYALSWTTFSTVGYGLAFPATSATTDDVRRCFGITIFTTLESFVGILFASFWGAIFLSKVTRVSSFAQVTFSDPIVLKYGPGLQKQADDEELSDDDEEKKVIRPPVAFTRSKLPCPVLEFRVLNRLEGQKHGEIIDATMNIVASIDEAQLRSTTAAQINKKKRRKKKGTRQAGRGVKDYLDDDEGVEEDAAEKSQKKLRQLLQKATSFKSRRGSVTLEEDTTGNLVSRKIFAKLEIESQEHPFFKRIWNARHVLDQDSPLLKQDAKDLIMLNGGHWPEELNSAEAVRASMHFDQILVSLSGTSNADCNSVYAQKVYDYVDLCVGYRFCNVLYRNAQGVLSVDPEILNDVTEQYGGGAEDLHRRQAESASEIFIL